MCPRWANCAPRLYHRSVTSSLRPTSSEPSRADLEREIARRMERLRSMFNLEHLRGHGDNASEIRKYYKYSRFGYRFVHSPEGAMHMALNPDGAFDRSGYEGQARLVQERLRPADRTVLELASGNGFNLALLATRNSSVSFTGIDLVPSQVHRANKALAALPNATTGVGDFQALDIPDDSQDFVFVVESLCHATDLPKAFSEVRRVLRESGRFVVIDAWRTADFDAASPMLRDAAASVELAMAVSAARTFPVWQQTAAACGFTVVEDLDLTSQIKPNLERLARIADKFLSRPILARAAKLVAPDTLLMNAIAGYLLPLTVEVGVHTYRLQTLEPARSGASA